MSHFLKQLCRDRRGNVLAIAAAAMPLVVGAAGMATDTIQWTLWKRQLQRAVDSAAIAGVYTRNQNDTQLAVEAAVTADLELNNHTGIDPQPNYPIVERPAGTTEMANPVQVTLAIQKPLPFSSFFMASAPVITAIARAASVPSNDEYCVIATDTSASKTGIEIAGSSDLDIDRCSLLALSRHPTQAANNGASSANGGKGSTVKAKTLAAVGGVNFSKSWDVDNYDPGAEAIADPFAGLQAPPKSSCVAAQTVASSSLENGADRTASDTDPTKIYCLNGALTVKGTVKLGKGTYVINNGDLTMNSSTASLSCTGCTIVMTNYETKGAVGSVKLTGGELGLVAPTVDTSADPRYNYRGMAFFQDKAATDDGKSGTNKINGNNKIAVTGAVYFPNQSLEYTGGGTTNAACLQIVAKRVTFTGSSKMKTSSACASSLPKLIQGGRRVRLVA